MKKALLFVGLAAATLSLTNCNKQEVDFPDQEGKITIRFVAPETKTVNDGLSTNWVKGDALTVFYAKAGTTEYSENTKFSFVDEDAAAEGAATGEATLDTGSYDWYAIYPYASQYTTPENTTCYATFGSSASGSQTQEGLDSKAHLAGRYYPLVGKATFAADATPSLQMHQLTTVIAVKVKNTTSAPIHVNTVSVTAPEVLVGGYFVNFAGDTPVIVPEADNYVSNTAKVSVTGENAVAAGASATFYMAVRPISVSNGDLTVKVIADEGSVEKTKKVTANFQAGHIKTLNVDFDDASGPAEIITATVAEFLAAEVSETQWYQLTGTVSNITNTTYGNFDLTDETGTVYVYGLTETKVAKNNKTFANLGIKAGDVVTLVSLRSEHNGSPQAGGNTPAYFISKEESTTALFDVEKDSFEVSADATSVTIKVTGNVAWTAEGSTGTTLDKTSGEGEGSIKVSFAANTDTQNPKEYTVFVRTTNPNVENEEIEVNITQAKADASGAKTLSLTMTEYVENNGCTVSASGAEVMYKTLQLNGSVRMSTTGEDNCGSFWVTSATNATKQWRLYQNKGGNVTVSVAEGCELQSVKLTYVTTNNGILLDAEGAQVANNETRTVSGSSVTYTVGNSSTNTNGQVRITGVEVVYTGDGTTFPDQPSGPTEITTSISMANNLSVYVGETAALNASSNVPGATITYESEDTAIATVDASGTVTGVADGTVKVYARIAGVAGEYTDASRYCTVTVTTKPVETEGTEVIIFSELGYSDAANVTTVEGKDFTMTFDQGEGRNAPKYYNNGTNVRIYNNNTVTFSSDKKIAKIEFYCTASYDVNAETTFSSGSCSGNVWEGSAKSIVMQNGSTTQIRLTGVKVTFE